ncbi:unnamed protein product [Cuscuta campestris]|uniref:Uncharacterized protein n=1 Tax=Cuscuta campestris TaxID=132261 RepID=A0A484LJ04_9ASTE|nr:unnamed protein product [Cuscuta campestris]
MHERTPSMLMAMFLAEMKRGRRRNRTLLALDVGTKWIGFSLLQLPSYSSKEMLPVLKPLPAGRREDYIKLRKIGHSIHAFVDTLKKMEGFRHLRYAFREEENTTSAAWSKYRKDGPVLDRKGKPTGPKASIDSFSAYFLTKWELTIAIKKWLQDWKHLLRAVRRELQQAEPDPFRAYIES